MMFRITTQVFFALLNLNVSKCVSLNNELCMIRSTLIDLTPPELSYCPFKVSLNKCTGGCNAADDLSRQTCHPSKTKDVNAKVFNMIRRINEAKLSIKHISWNCKCKFNSTICNSNQRWNNETWRFECKNYRMCKKVYNCNPSTCICENGKYLKSITYISVIVWDEIMSATHSASTILKNAIPINMTNIWW